MVDFVDMDEIDKYIKYIDVQLNYSTNTVEAYHRDLYQFRDFMELRGSKLDFSDVSRSDVKMWVVKMVEDDEISARSVVRKVSSLRGLYKFLIINGYEGIDPTEGLVMPKVKKRLPEFVTEDKMEQAMDRELFEEGFGGDRDRLVIEVLYMTGMRVSELVGMRREDVDIYNNVLRVMGKRSKERLVPIGINLKGSIERYFAELDQRFEVGKGYFIVDNKGEGVSRAYIYRLVSNHLHKVSTQKKLSPHVLRHTFATHLLNNGCDINAIKELLGHSSLEATQVYTHNSIKKLKNIYNQAHPRA